MVSAGLVEASKVYARVAVHAMPILTIVQKSAVENTMSLSQAEKFAVRQYAAGERINRDEMKRIYYEHIADMGVAEPCRELKFLSEVFSPAPDAVYRNLLRRRIIGCR